MNSFDFGRARKKRNIFVYDLPLIRSWHAHTELKPQRGKTFAYFGYNWWDLMASGIIQQSKYYGKHRFQILVTRDNTPGIALINCSKKPIVLMNQKTKDVYNLYGYGTKIYNKVSKTPLAANNVLVANRKTCEFHQITVGDASVILVGIEDLLNGTSDITKTSLFKDFLLASGVLNSEQYYSTTGLNAYIDKAERIGKKINVETDSSMMDWVGAMVEHWNEVNPSKRSPSGKSIPRKIHWIWLAREPGNPNPLREKYFKFMKTWIKRNPNSEYFIWTDSDPEHLGLPSDLERHIQIMDEDAIYQTFKKLPKESRKGALNMYENHPNVGSRADTLRQAILYIVGGVYADINDMSCMVPLEAYMDHFDFMAGMEPMLYVNNAFVASAPGHEIPRNFIQFIAERSDEFIDDWDPDEETEEKDNLVVSQTGPVAFSGIIYGVLTDEEGNLEEGYERTCIFPSKFVYSNYEISESPLTWVSPISLSGHFDERAYLK